MRLYLVFTFWQQKHFQFHCVPPLLTFPNEVYSSAAIIVNDTQRSFRHPINSNTINNSESQLLSTERLWQQHQHTLYIAVDY
jgi:hypothetical protein